MPRVWLSRAFLLALLFGQVPFEPAESRAQTTSLSGYALTVSPVVQAPDGTVTVQWTAPSSHSTQDWIGIFSADMPSAGNTVVSYKYVPSGGSGLLTFKAPNTLLTTNYQFRYFLNNTFTQGAASNPLTVKLGVAPSSPSTEPTQGTTTTTTANSSLTSSTTTQHTLVANPGAAKPGQAISVSWKAPTNHSPADWIGLFLVGTPSAGNTIVAWRYVPTGTNGLLNFTAPNTSAPRTYEFRYLLTNGYSEATRSNAVTVSSLAASTPSTSVPTTSTGGSTSTGTTSSGSGTTSTTNPSPSPPPTTTVGGTCPDGSPLAFPEAEGFGRCAKGGRGGRTIDVTNLNNSGPGSLRQCAEVETGPRTCRLTVPGTISLGTYDITVRNDFLTIDGSLAPVALKDGGLDIRANHTIIRHLRIRPGSKSWLSRGSNANGIFYRSTETGSQTHDHIADHVSISWTTDDAIAVINGTQNVTIQNSIVSEGLMNGPSCSGCYGKGILVGTANQSRETLSVIRTLSAHIFIRFPQATGGDIDFVNNVDYNGNGSTAQIAPYYSPVKINMVGNYWKDGPSAIPFNLGYNVIRTIGNMAYSAQSGIYVRDNVGRSRTTGDMPESRIIWGDNGGIPIQSSRYAFPSVTTTSALQAYEDVLARSGAQPRDSVDARVVNDVRNGTGMLIHDPSQVGGWPTLVLPAQ